MVVFLNEQGQAIDDHNISYPCIIKREIKLSDFLEDFQKNHWILTNILDKFIQLMTGVKVYHYGVAGLVDGCDLPQVIHFHCDDGSLGPIQQKKMSVVCATDLTGFAAGHPIYLCYRNDKYEQSMIQRCFEGARQWLTHAHEYPAYNLLNCNCENFVDNCLKSKVRTQPVGQSKNLIRMVKQNPKFKEMYDRDFKGLLGASYDQFVNNLVSLLEKI